MPDTVSVHKDNNLIYVESKGKITVADLTSTTREVLKIHHMSGLNGVLVNTCQVESLPGIPYIYDVGVEVSKVADTLIFAIVISQHIRKEIEFFEAVTQNRGISAKIFKTEENAIEWLKDKMPE